MKTQKRICVLGLGYIGLPTASLLANRGYRIIGVDVNPHAVDTINRGEIHIFEPDLDTFVRAAVESGTLKAFTAPREAEVYLICVPTPFRQGTAAVPEPDVSYVMAAAESIAPLVKRGDMIILESTSPVGTTERIVEMFSARQIDVSSMHFAYCPERVLPGRVMLELVQNDRIIGGVTEGATQAVKEFYETFVQGRLLLTTARMAEMAKLVENSYRDVNVAFANELSIVCDQMGLDVWRLIEIVNHHPRVKILRPGAGVGGHCIAVDPWFIVSNSPSAARLIRTAREVNDAKATWVTGKILKAIDDFASRVGRPAKVGALGLAFKPDIDDLRNSPALEICRALRHRGVDLLVCEPNIDSHPDFALSRLEVVLGAADIVAVLVGHSPFRRATVPPEKLVLDFCGARQP